MSNLYIWNFFVDNCENSITYLSDSLENARIEILRVLLQIDKKSRVSIKQIDEYTSKIDTCRDMNMGTVQRFQENFRKMTEINAKRSAFMSELKSEYGQIAEFFLDLNAPFMPWHYYPQMRVSHDSHSCLMDLSTLIIDTEPIIKPTMQRFTMVPPTLHRVCFFSFP